MKVVLESTWEHLHKWRFYPKFKIEIFEYDRLINNRMQGDKL